MYLLKENSISFKNQSEVAKTIGLDQATISRMMNRKQAVSKLVAYCITKYYNQYAEIEDYFDYIKKGK